MGSKPWVECENGHQNLRATIDSYIGQCPQCESQYFKEISSPQISSRIGQQKEKRDAR